MSDSEVFYRCNDSINDSIDQVLREPGLSQEDRELVENARALRNLAIDSSLATGNALVVAACRCSFLMLYAAGVVEAAADSIDPFMRNSVYRGHLFKFRETPVEKVTTAATGRFVLTESEWLAFKRSMEGKIADLEKRVFDQETGSGCLSTLVSGNHSYAERQLKLLRQGLFLVGFALAIYIIGGWIRSWLGGA